MKKFLMSLAISLSVVSSFAQIDTVLTATTLRRVIHYNKAAIDALVLTMFQKNGSDGLDMPSTAITWYNTAVDATNYERLQIYWTSNIATIAAQSGGTGTARTLQMASGSTNINIVPSTSLFSTNAYIQSTRAAANTTTSLFRTTGSFTASTAINNGWSLLNTINQTSTAGFRMLWISPYIQAAGSNAIKFLADIGVNTANDGGGTHTRYFSVSNTGRIFMAVPTEYADNSAAKTGGLSDGDIYRTGDVLKIVHP